MSPFKIIITSVFVVSFVVGIGLFAFSKSTNQAQSADLVVWGTLSQETFNIAYENSTLKSNKLIKIKYIRKDSSTFDSELVEALAEGIGPDIVILRDDYVYKNRNKLFVIPYKSYTQRVFKDTFIEAGEVFLETDGVIALPFTVDPLVMYWNRDLFSNSSIPEVPKYWDQIYNLIEKTTKKDANANVLQSSIALGEWRNISNAKEIISMLLLQAGTPITLRNTNEVTSVLNQQLGYAVAPSQSAIGFYTQFSNPTATAYTWNRSLPLSSNMFISGKLATYIGFASELFTIQQKNSNLNFDVTSVPQIRDSGKKMVFGRMYALAITKQSKQIAGAFTTITALTEKSAITKLETVTNLPPVRRDVLSERPSDAYRAIFYDSALISRSWIDPDPAGTEKVFRDMIESITSGKSRQGDALNRAENDLEVLLK